MDSLQTALERVPADTEDRAEFRAEFALAQGLWETIAPDAVLDDWEDDYRWYAQVYAAIPAETDDDDLLWERLGPKTRELVHQHMRNVRVTDRNIAVVIADAETIRRMSEKVQLPPVPTEYEGKSAREILDSLTARIQRTLDGGGEGAVGGGEVGADGGEFLGGGGECGAAVGLDAAEVAGDVVLGDEAGDADVDARLAGAGDGLVLEALDLLLCSPKQFAEVLALALRLFGQSML